MRIRDGARERFATVLVPTGSTRAIEFVADNPGDWALHCRMTHHMMNQMGHRFPNAVGADAERLRRSIGRVVPGRSVPTSPQKAMMSVGIACRREPSPERRPPTS